MKKGVWVLFAGWLAVMLMLQNSAAATEALKPQIRFPVGMKSLSLPVTLFDHVIYLPVSINGGAGRDFVLDTGASDLTAIDQETAAFLGLEMRRGDTLRGAGSEDVQSNWLSGVSLTVAGLQITGLPVMTIPLRRMEPYWGKVKEGLLGGNVLARVVTEIDYENSRVTFHEVGTFQAEDRGLIIPLEIVQNTPLVRAKLKGAADDPGAEGLFMLDTGVRQSFINTPFTARNGLIAKSPATVENITGFGISGQVKGIVGRVAAIELGPFVLERPVVELCTEKEGVSASADFDGIIGADILSRFRVIFDYGSRRLFLEKNSRFSLPFEYDTSGVYVIATGKRNVPFQIENVVSGSPAADACLRRGDRLVAVNGQPASAFTLESLKRLFREENQSIKLEIERGAKTLSVTLRLRRLI